MKENELISIIQNPPVTRPLADESTAQGQEGRRTDDFRDELMERLHADNVCYTGVFSSFGPKC